MVVVVVRSTVLCSCSVCECEPRCGVKGRFSDRARLERKMERKVGLAREKNVELTGTFVVFGFFPMVHRVSHNGSNEGLDNVDKVE